MFNQESVFCFEKEELLLPMINFKDNFHYQYQYVQNNSPTFPRKRTSSSSVYSLHNIYPSSAVNQQQVYPPQQKTYPSVYPRTQQAPVNHQHQVGGLQSNQNMISFNHQQPRGSSPTAGRKLYSGNSSGSGTKPGDDPLKMVCVNPNLLCTDPFSDYLNLCKEQNILDGVDRMTIQPSNEISCDIPLIDKVPNSPSGALDCSVGGSINEDELDAVADSDDSTTSLTPPRSRKRKFKDLDAQDELSSTDDDQIDRLPASKSPVMEALSYCAIKRLGIEIYECKDETEASAASVIFKVIDFDLYYKYSTAICSKQNPTEDVQSRIKSLRRWFTNFPAKRERSDSQEFLLQVKPELAKKVHDMVGKHGCIESIKKRRRC